MKKPFLFAALFFVALISSSFKKKPAVAKKKTSLYAVSRSLAYPVAGRRSRVGSFWGDDRDGGRRSHEGIDIFARKGTPVVAVTDGVVVAKGTSPRGGKVLWLRSGKQPWSAYYAHLDKYAVRQGQYVKKGQVLGTVGNTGNARYTPSHLHFGIYTARGAVNPLPYVKHSPKVAVAKPSSKKAAVKKTKRIKRSRR